MVPEKLHY